MLHKGQFILTVHVPRSTKHGVRNKEHAARSTQHGSIFIHALTYRSCVRMIKYIVFNGKLKFALLWNFYPCSVPRAISSVLRAAGSVLRAKHVNHTNMPTVTNCVTRFPCSMGSATGRQGEHCP